MGTAAHNARVRKLQRALRRAMSPEARREAAGKAPIVIEVGRAYRHGDRVGVCCAVFRDAQGERRVSLRSVNGSFYQPLASEVVMVTKRRRKAVLA